MQLHSFFNSSTSYRVRIALALKGLPYDYLAVNLRKLEQRGADYVALNPSAGVPLLVDGDTGYGEALNVMHMVRVFEEAGAGAVHLEDQLLPKKCGHLNDKRLAAPADMAAKVAAAARARR